MDTGFLTISLPALKQEAISARTTLPKKNNQLLSLFTFGIRYVTVVYCTKSAIHLTVGTVAVIRGGGDWEVASWSLS